MGMLERLMICTKEPSEKTGLINPLALRAAKTGLTILLIFSPQKRFFSKYLKEKCLPEYYQQLSFK